MAANPNVRVRAVKGETDVYACNFTSFSGDARYFNAGRNRFRFLILLRA